MSSPQLLDRLPTLFEVLNRISEKPIDLWSFYKFLREHYAGVDYLEFWLDTANHYALARAYADEQQQIQGYSPANRLSLVARSLPTDSPAGRRQLAQAASPRAQWRKDGNFGGADYYEEFDDFPGRHRYHAQHNSISGTTTGTTTNNTNSNGLSSSAGRPSRSSGRQYTDAASLTDSQVFDLLNTAGPDSSSDVDWRRSINSNNLRYGGSGHDRHTSGSSSETNQLAMYKEDAAASIPRIGQVPKSVGYSSGSAEAISGSRGDVRAGNDDNQLLEGFQGQITEKPVVSHSRQNSSFESDEASGRAMTPTNLGRAHANGRHMALPRSAEEAAVPRPVSNAAAYAAAQAEQYRASAKYLMVDQRHRLETASVEDVRDRDQTAPPVPVGSVSREQLEANADRIISQYLMAGAPREIVLPRDMAARVRSAALMGHGAGRLVASLFNEPREYVFDVLEREAFPAFLQMRALSNIESRCIPVRLIAGLVVLFGAFWLSFVFIFLKWDPKATRCWVILPFSVGWYLVMSSLYSLDPLLGILGLTESGWFRLEKISEPYVQFLIRRRSIFAGLVTVIVTACFCVLFIFVPGHRL